jgi:hypothetical protein
MAGADFTVTVGPAFKACFAATSTVSSSVAGFNVTVPLMLWVAEASKVGGVTTGMGAPLVLTAVILVSVGTGTPEMTAVA